MGAGVASDGRTGSASGIQAELAAYFRGLVEFPPEATDQLSDEPYVRDGVEILDGGGAGAWAVNLDERRADSCNNLLRPHVYLA